MYKQVLSISIIIPKLSILEKAKWCEFLDGDGKNLEDLTQSLCDLVSMSWEKIEYLSKIGLTTQKSIGLVIIGQWYQHD